MFLAGFTDPGSIPVSDEQRAGRAAAEAENHSMGVKLDELAIKAAALTRLGRMQEAVIFLREGKALKAEQDAKYPDGFCTACLHQRPSRAHHCRVTDRCIARYDHYCCYIGSSVGLANYKYYVLFVWTTFLHSCVVLAACITRLSLLAFSLLAEHSSPPPLTAPEPSYAYAGEVDSSSYDAGAAGLIQSVVGALSDAPPPSPPALVKQARAAHTHD